ncbi:MAG: helix-turn-helix domain-containing protein [Planctomycetes bacterium]|nr:helix-turn-helix domain-containing protein [Planctomycetota bacterium]
MIAELLNISDEELGRILSTWLYGGRDVPIETYDVFALVVMTWRELARLKGRFNKYDRQGPGEMLTVKETMRITGLSRSCLYRKMKHGILLSTKIDGRRMIYRESVERWLRTIDQYKACIPWTTFAATHDAETSALIREIYEASVTQTPRMIDLDDPS